MGIVICRGENN